MAEAWRVRLSEVAQADLDDIYVWTAERFGASQADSYRRALLDALRALRQGPDVPGSRGMPSLPSCLRCLHVARKRQRGRHFLVFKAFEDGWIEVLRILHDSMDLARHLPETPEAGPKD